MNEVAASCRMRQANRVHLATLLVLLAGGVVLYYAGELLGMAGGPVRPGLPQITEKERAALRQDLEGTGLVKLAPIAKAA